MTGPRREGQDRPWPKSSPPLPAEGRDRPSSRAAAITASAYHVRDALALTSDDCCLNIMPLFHIHGLIAAVLASLSAGASVACTPGFQAFRFFSWFDEVRPSWFTAVPTMHQALLLSAERNKDIISRGRLRLVRSSSASLPAPVMAALEEVFGVPVIESYGMTEAAHQMTSNLPQRESRTLSSSRSRHILSLRPRRRSQR
jgi:oxalate---CoA ligase